MFDHVKFGVSDYAASHHRSRWPSLIEFSFGLAQAHTLQENSCLTT